MDRTFYLDLAAAGARLPIGADLILKQHPDHGVILNDAARLATVLMEAADAYHTPLAFPIMDLTLEKCALMEMLGVTDDAGTWHLPPRPDPVLLERFQANLSHPWPRRMQANIQALRILADQGVGRYFPIGMSIGPVSLMSKLLVDPITPLFLAGSGLTAAEDEDVATLDLAAELAIRMVLRYVEAQAQAGAAAIFIAEPAANRCYFSPRQMEAGSNVWEHYVLAANRRVLDLLQRRDVDLFFHCCGDLTDAMVASFRALDPALLSLGSSRCLWHDAALLPRSIVLYGNLPTKLFYSDESMPAARVAQWTNELTRRMTQVGHPFILGSECDVLSVAGREATIRRKLDVMLTHPSA